MQTRALVAAACAAALAACSADDLNITNPNVATVDGAKADPSALQMLAVGLQTDYRSQRVGWITQVGRIGRESYHFSPQEGRNTTHYLIGISVAGVQKLDPTGFVGAVAWGGQYGTLRDVYNFKNTVNESSTLTAAQKAAALGFAGTIEAAVMLEVIQAHDSLGAITEIREQPSELAPFVTRDSVYKFILGTFDAAATSLASGGAAFPFTVHSGFAGFNTPTTFAQFNRAMRARASAYYATYGGGTTAWQGALTALQGSFLNAGAATRAQFDAGVYQPYGVSPDSPNGLTQATNTDLYAHLSIQADVNLKVDGSPDSRYTAKIRTGLPSRQGPITGSGPTSASSTLGFSIWPAQSSTIPVIRNEELILLRAEARLATGDKAGTIADINQVRVNSGGLPPTTVTAASANDAILSAILYEKRYSLLMEGHRWIDMKRYGRLDQLPLDVNSGANKNFVARVFPLSQAECLQRANKSGDLLGPNGQNNCAP